jgi:hypothetical protein
MKDCAEDSLIWMLIVATILWQVGFGSIGLLFFTLPVALIAACVITRLLPNGNRLTLAQKSGSLRK